MPATGADVPPPPELFPYILKFVGRDNAGMYYTADWRADVKSCSLVCLYWGNRCREYLFGLADIRVKTAAELESLDRYVVAGCPRLIPLWRLVGRVVVVQAWGTPSWCHKLRASTLYHALSQVGNTSHFPLSLELLGPIPPTASRSALHSPHWSLPQSLPTHFLSVFTSLLINGAHFPCLSDLTLLLRQCTVVVNLELVNVTWDKNDFALRRQHPGLASGSINHRWPQSVSAQGCTDDLLVCQLAHAHLRSSAGLVLTRMDEREHDALLMIVQLSLDSGLGEDVSEPRVFGRRTILIEHTTFILPTIDAAAEELSSVRICVGSTVGGHTMVATRYSYDDRLGTPPNNAAPVRSLELVVDLYSEARHPDSSARNVAELTRVAPQVIKAFHTQLARFSILRSADVLAPLHIFQRTVQTFPELALAQTATAHKRLACHWLCPHWDLETPERKIPYGLGGYVRVDPATLDLYEGPDARPPLPPPPPPPPPLY